MATGPPGHRPRLVARSRLKRLPQELAAKKLEAMAEAKREDAQED
ncbi:hypothetical protein [Xanthomonas sacchari]|nr:hypothetical protein [Xanthomonas sacchari]